MESNPPDPSRWENRGETLIASTRILDLKARHYRHPVRDQERDFVVIAAPDWVNVVAVTPEGRLVLVTQFRYGIDAFSLEVPGGVIEKGEDPVDAAVRELCEETGFAGESARLLGFVHSNPAFIDNRTHLVLVENARPTGKVAWDHDEEIAVTTVPVDDVFALGRSGRITHALVLNALWLFEPIWKGRNAGRPKPVV